MDNNKKEQVSDLEYKLTQARQELQKQEQAYNELKEMDLEGSSTIFGEDFRIIYRGNMANYSLRQPGGNWSGWIQVKAEGQPQFDSEVKTNADFANTHCFYVFGDYIACHDPADSVGIDCEDRRKMICYVLDPLSLPVKGVANPNLFSEWKWKKYEMEGAAIAYQNWCGNTPSYSKEAVNSIIRTLQNPKGTWRTKGKIENSAYWPYELELNEAKRNLDKAAKKVAELESDMQKLEGTGPYDISKVKKSKFVAVLLAILLGFVGADQFYMRRKIYGGFIAALFICSVYEFNLSMLGLVAAIWMFDIIWTLTLSQTKFKQRFLPIKE